jgi:uncharacterized protein (UPF0128 family)
VRRVRREKRKVEEEEGGSRLAFALFEEARNYKPSLLDQFAILRCRM